MKSWKLWSDEKGALEVPWTTLDREGRQSSCAIPAGVAVRTVEVDVATLHVMGRAFGIQEKRLLHDDHLLLNGDKVFIKTSRRRISRGLGEEARRIQKFRTGTFKRYQKGAFAVSSAEAGRWCLSASCPPPRR